MERIITKSFARLMGRGTHRGFITYEELSKSLGKRNLSDENLSQAFIHICLLYTSPSPRDGLLSRMPSSA